jgi:rRNA-processing protein EBP2
VPHRRPDDFFAEMLKSDAHMARVKDKLLFEQKKISAVEQRKQRATAAEFGKQVAAERVKARGADKKATLDALASWRKQRGRHGSGGGRVEGGGGAELDAVLEGGGGSGRGGGKPNFRRAGKDAKYGFGGQPKRVAKANSAKSSRSLKDFAPGRNKALPPGVRPKQRGGGGGGGGGAKKGGARPGKAARAAKKGGGGGRR